MGVLGDANVYYGKRDVHDYMYGSRERERELVLVMSVDAACMSSTIDLLTTWVQLRWPLGDSCSANHVEPAARTAWQGGGEGESHTHLSDRSHP